MSQDTAIIMDLKNLASNLPMPQSKVVERAIQEIVRLRQLRLEVQK